MERKGKCFRPLRILVSIERSSSYLKAVQYVVSISNNAIPKNISRFHALVHVKQHAVLTEAADANGIARQSMGGHADGMNKTTEN